MAETEATKTRRPNRFSEIMKSIATVGGVVSGGGVGSIFLWGGGLAVATAVTVFSVKIKNKQSPGKATNGCCPPMDRAIESECIKRFGFSVRRPYRLLQHHDSMSWFLRSKMEVEGKELVSTRYLISEEKIVLQIEWRDKTATSTKEEIVIFDNLKNRKNNAGVLSLEESVLDTLSVSADDFAGKDPLGTLIQSIMDNQKALEQMVSAKQALGGGEDQDDGMQDDSRSKLMQGSSIEEIETERDSKGEDAKKEAIDEGTALIPRAMETAKEGILEPNVSKMRMQIWLLLVVIVMLTLLASPKLISY